MTQRRKRYDKQLKVAAAIDARHREVVGWSMSSRITEKLAIDALNQAVGREDQPNDYSLVFHDDQGSQCAPRIPGMPRVARDSPVDVKARKSVGRCGGRVVLQGAQARADRWQKMRIQGRGEAGGVQMHQALLQQAAVAFQERIYGALRLRARCRLKMLK